MVNFLNILFNFIFLKLLQFKGVDDVRYPYIECGGDRGMRVISINSHFHALLFPLINSCAIQTHSCAYFSILARIF